jgi:putative ABC transport system permease protein
VFQVVLAEYLTLGVLASIVALLLAIAAGWSVSRFVFDGSFGLPALPLSALMLLVVGLTVIVGLANSRDVVRRPPLEVLRQE